jgi:hypothetical protein
MTRSAGRIALAATAAIAALAVVTPLFQGITTTNAGGEIPPPPENWVWCVYVNVDNAHVSTKESSPHDSEVCVPDVLGPSK